jgi:peptidoglycan/LPS O-acetylase OafA/YrhL
VASTTADAAATPAAAATVQTGQRQRVVWFAHFARAIAALVVLYARYIVEFRDQKVLVAPFVGTQPIPLADIPWNWLVTWYQFPREHFTIDLGATAVGVFFLLSGFVIPFALERRTLPAYGIRRILRVYPTLWAVTGLAVFITFLANENVFPYKVDRVFTSATLVNQYAGSNWIDPSYWTIPIEEIFYVVAAVLAMTRLLRRPIAIVLTAAAVGGISLWVGRVTVPTDLEPGALPGVDFWIRHYVGRNLGFMTFVFIGVGLHMLFRRFWNLAQFVVVTASICGIFAVSMYHGPYQKPYIGGAQSTGYFNSFMLGLVIFLLLYYLGDRLPRNKPLELVGNISYPIYLVGAVIGWAYLVFFTRAVGSYFIALPITVAAVLLTAYGLHRLVEKPTMDFSQRFTSKPGFRKERSWSDPLKPWFRRRRAEEPEPEADVVVPAPPAARTDEEVGAPVVEHHEAPPTS